jgi:hypothetical protein
MAAYSYIRENKMDEARKQLEAFASAMKRDGQTAFESEALIAMAFIEKDVTSSFADLDKASSDLRADSKVPKADRDERLAKILAHKVRIAALAGDDTRTQQALTELDVAAKDTTDPLIQAAWKGGHGASLFVHKIYDAAIADLLDDQDNPFSEMLLVKAYQASGNTKAAAELKDSVMTLRRLEIDLWMAQQALKS